MGAFGAEACCSCSIVSTRHAHVGDDWEVGGGRYVPPVMRMTFPVRLGMSLGLKVVAGMVRFKFNVRMIKLAFKCWYWI